MTLNYTCSIHTINHFEMTHIYSTVWCAGVYLKNDWSINWPTTSFYKRSYTIANTTTINCSYPLFYWTNTTQQTNIRIIIIISIDGIFLSPSLFRFISLSYTYAFPHMPILSLCSLSRNP